MSRYLLILIVAVALSAFLLGVLVAPKLTEHTVCALLPGSAETTQDCVARIVRTSEAWRIVRTDEIRDGIVIVTLERPRLRLPV